MPAGRPDLRCRPPVAQLVKLSHLAPDGLSCGARRSCMQPFVGVATTAAFTTSLPSRTWRYSSEITNSPRSRRMEPRPCRPRRSGDRRRRTGCRQDVSRAAVRPAVCRRRHRPVGRLRPALDASPAGPLHDVASELGDAARRALREAAQPPEIFTAVHEHLSTHRSVLVIDDLHWADQGPSTCCGSCCGAPARLGRCLWARSATTNSTSAIRCGRCSATSRGRRTRSRCGCNRCRSPRSRH